MTKLGLCFLLAPLALLLAQPPQPPPPPNPPEGSRGRVPMTRQGQLAPGHPKFQGPGRGPGGRWWMDPATAQRIGLTEEQRGKLVEIYQANRLRLIDLNASLQKEQVIMEPMMESDRPDQNKVLAQIDKIAQARAELEKANARMLLGFRGVLSQEQWKKLQQPEPRVPGQGGGPGPKRNNR